MYEQWYLRNPPASTTISIPRPAHHLDHLLHPRPRPLHLLFGRVHHPFRHISTTSLRRTHWQCRRAVPVPLLVDLLHDAGILCHIGTKQRTLGRSAIHDPCTRKSWVREQHCLRGVVDQLDYRFFEGKMFSKMCFEIADFHFLRG